MTWIVFAASQCTEDVVWRSKCLSNWPRSSLMCVCLEWVDHCRAPICNEI